MPAKKVEPIEAAAPETKYSITKVIDMHRGTSAILECGFEHLSAARRLGRNLKKLAAEIESYDKAMEPFRDKACLKDDAGKPLAGKVPGTIRLSPEKAEWFQEQEKKALADEVELNLERVFENHIPSGAPGWAVMTIESLIDDPTE